MRQSSLSNLLHTFTVLARLTVKSFRHLRMLSRVYSAHGVLLPSNCIFRHPENVEIGAGFGLSEHCSIFCQDPERGSSLKFGDHVKLNIGVMINADCGGRIVIGNGVLIGPYAVIRAANHRIDARDLPIIEQGHQAGSIVIEDDVWLGAHVTVLPNVRIGRGAVIAAGSVVSRDVPAMAIAAGAPAAVLRYRGEAKPELF